MEKPSARTSASNFIYWFSFAILVALTIWKVKFSWSEGGVIWTAIDSPAVWILLIPILLSPGPLLLAAVAQYFRSGATIWLLALLAVQFLPNIPMTNEEILRLESTGFVLGRIAAMFTAFALILIPYLYLVRRGELRKP